MKYLKFLCFLAWLGTSAWEARAEFDLPLFFDVPKTVQVNEDRPHSELEMLANIENLTVELAMTSGNMLRTSLIELLNRMPGKIRVRLRADLSKVHVDQMRLLDNFEVIYPLSRNSLNSNTSNLLNAVGPIKKYIQIPADFDSQFADWLRRLKFYVPVIYVQNEGLPTAVTEWLKERNRRPRFVLPVGIDPAIVNDLDARASVSYEVATRNNQIDPALLSVLKKVSGATVVIRVDELLTIENVKQFCQLQSFSLKVDLNGANSSVLGLASLLNRIAPPRLNR